MTLLNINPIGAMELSADVAVPPKKSDVLRIKTKIEKKLTDISEKVKPSFTVSTWSFDPLPRNGSVKFRLYVKIPSNGGVNGNSLTFDEVAALRKMTYRLGIKGLTRFAFNLTHTTRSIGVAMSYVIAEANVVEASK